MRSGGEGKHEEGGGRRGALTAVSGFFGRRRRDTRKEPDYVRTSKFDGSKSVELDKFIKDKEIQKQIERLAKEAE